MPIQCTDLLCGLPIVAFERIFEPSHLNIQIFRIGFRGLLPNTPQGVRMVRHALQRLVEDIEGVEVRCGRFSLA